MGPLEFEITALRRMTPAAKLDVMRSLIRLAYELKAAAIRASQPDLTEQEIRERTRALVAGDGP